MDGAKNLGGGGGTGGGSASAGGGANTGAESVVDDGLDDLWPEQRPSTAAARLAGIWVANPATSHQWTYGLGGVE